MPDILNQLPEEDSFTCHEAIFFFFANEHNLVLTNSEIDDIVRVVNKAQEEL